MTHIKVELHIHLHRSEADGRLAEPESENRHERRENDKDWMDFVEGEVGKTRAAGSYSTAGNYLTAARSLQQFCGASSLSLRQLTPELMENYQKWLRQRNICLNTISCYMRSLRSLYHKAVEQHLTADRNLFAKVFTGSTHTLKRSVPQEDIRAIAGLRLKRGSFNALARDLFLFCFYAQGMPFVDAAFLTHRQLRGGTIVYQRHKTGRSIHIALEPSMERIIRRYYSADSPYVFPIITTEEPRRAFIEYQSALNHYNRALKTLARMAGIRSNLSSYVVRHSWASIAYSENVDLPVISQALGHNNTNTTLIYIRELDDERLQTANRRIIQSVNRRKKGGDRR